MPGGGRAARAYRYEPLPTGAGEPLDAAGALEEARGSAESPASRQPWQPGAAGRAACGAAAALACLAALPRALVAARPAAALRALAPAGGAAPGGPEDGGLVALALLRPEGPAANASRAEGDEASAHHAGGRWQSWGPSPGCPGRPQAQLPEGSQLKEIEAPLALEPCMLACECTAACLGVKFEADHRRCQLWIGPPGSSATRRLAEPGARASGNATGENGTQCQTDSATDSGLPRRQCHPDRRLAPGTPVLVRGGAPGEWRLGVVKVSYNSSFMLELNRTGSLPKEILAQAEAAKVLDLGRLARLQAGDHVLAKVSTRLQPVQVVRAYQNHTLDVLSQDGELMHAVSASSRGALPAGVAEVYTAPEAAVPALPAKGAQRNIVEFDVDVQNVSFQTLAAEPALLTDLQMAMQQEISSQTDCGVPPMAVRLASTPGQGRYRVSLDPPTDVQVRKLEKQLQEWGGKTLMEEGLAARISSVSGIQDALQGTVGVAMSGVTLAAEPGGVALGSAGPPARSRPWLSGLQQQALVGEASLAVGLLAVVCYMACTLPRQGGARTAAAEEGLPTRCTPPQCLCCGAAAARAGLAAASAVWALGVSAALPIVLLAALGLLLVAELAAIGALHREGASRRALARAEHAARHADARRLSEKACEAARRAEAARAAAQELHDRVRAEVQQHGAPAAKPGALRGGDDCEGGHPEQRPEPEHGAREPREQRDADAGGPCSRACCVPARARGRRGR